MGRLERLSIQGAANTQIDGIEGHDLELSLAGAGQIDAAGTCRNVSVDIKGAGSINAHALACNRVQVEIMGSGDAAVHASDEVIVSIFGAGRVDVYGDPARVVPAKIRGAATVELR